MRDNDGRKLDHTTLEQLRIRAVHQIQQGAHPEAIAEALGMARSTVFGWMAAYREGGLEALRARPVPGRRPKLRAQAAKVRATIYFADEAGIRSDYHAGTTWAPVGQTPVVATTGARHQVNLISAVTPGGVLRFASINGKLDASKFIDFCRRLLGDTAGPVFLIIDSHPVHRSRAVKAFAASTKGR